MSLKILQASLVDGFSRKHCALCGASLDSVLEEVPCLHWFITPGPRGFQIDRLAPVFDMFDLDAAIAFLQIFATVEPSRANLPVHRTWTEDGLTRAVIYWRRRRWLFEYKVQPGQTVCLVTEFELTIMFQDVVMQRARVELGQRERNVVVTTLDKRRLDVPDASLQERR